MLTIWFSSCNNEGNCNSEKEEVPIQDMTFDSPEEELCFTLEKEGWMRVSNCTNVYRRDIADIVDNVRIYKATYWYTASIYSKNINSENKYIIARPVYYSREDNTVHRTSSGLLEYKTFPIAPCNFIDKYGQQFNGYINDGGSIAYVVY